MRVRTFFTIAMIILSVVSYPGAVADISVEDRLILDRIRTSISVLKIDSEVAEFADPGLEGRVTGSEGATKVAKVIQDEFSRANLSPLKLLNLSSYEMKFPLLNQDGRTTSESGYNIVGMIKGQTDSKKYYLVASHYDYLGGTGGCFYNGADEAAGISGVLEIARIFKKLNLSPRHNIIFVVFSGSMQGYQGAANLASGLQKVDLTQLGMFYLHRLGGAGGNKIDVFTENYPGGAFLGRYMKTAGDYYSIKVNLREESDNGSDAAMFTAKGLPAIGIDWDWSKKNHPYYETIYDDFDNVKLEGLSQTITVTAAAVWLLANKE